MKRLLFVLLFCFFSIPLFCQDIYCRDATKANREKLYRNLVNNTINRNLSLPLTDTTEENWQDAFHGLALIRYRSPWVDNRIKTIFNSFTARSMPFQYAFLELLHSNYPGVFIEEVRKLLYGSTDITVFSAAALYILKTSGSKEEKDFIFKIAAAKTFSGATNILLPQFLYELKDPDMVPSVYTLLQKDFLPGQVLLISFQRKNRDFPGITIVRDTAGNFIKNDTAFFYVAQLARSLNNLPGYLSNGNTPEGLFRMDGFGNSRSGFIGPTTNIQLTMPFEYKAAHFYNDSTLIDTSRDYIYYKNLLPASFRNYFPLYQSYYAGAAGRTEIIAHGTATDPSYYRGTAYYPFTPTLGCLSVKEKWSDADGKLLESDELKLVEAINRAGGPHGYAIVINIDNKQTPVSIDDIVPFLKLAGQN